MNSQYIVNSLDKILTWIMRFVLVNLLWLFYTVMGGIAGGIFPATLSVLKIFRKWILGDLEIPIRKTFKDEFRKDFGKANMVGWILTFAGLILYGNYLAIKSLGEINTIFLAAFYLLITFYINLVVWSFPQLAHYNGDIKQFFKNAIIMGFGKFHYTIAISFYIFAVLYISLKFPGLLPFFTVSLTVFGWTWMSVHLFQKNDTKMQQQLLPER
ncbi:YesL family protein [Jeotgalibacillus sp. ET6]|uniref:YesL family protein n=1 Tax=Jeotgalibacillus sp. ET6 TaxID=3037260 RepID=UPI0024183B85|nr:YesL family protein [Jeotgalibacillus sp. ET6]MDG5473682.1 YesL family protein [Jeotgalibacillus sp. ET6]